MIKNVILGHPHVTKEATIKVNCFVTLNVGLTKKITARNNTKKMKYKLLCKSDPVALGIENDDESWDLEKLKEHIKQCKICSCALSKLFEDEKGELDDK